MKVNPIAFLVWTIAALVGWLLAGAKGAAIATVCVMSISLVITLVEMARK